MVEGLVIIHQSSAFVHYRSQQLYDIQGTILPCFVDIILTTGAYENLMIEMMNWKTNWSLKGKSRS